MVDAAAQTGGTETIEVTALKLPNVRQRRQANVNIIAIAGLMLCWVNFQNGHSCADTLEGIQGYWATDDTKSLE